MTIYIGALLMIAKKQKQLMNSVNEWINKNVVYPYKGILEYKKE
jgi:hypothetical protein